MCPKKITQPIKVTPVIDGKIKIGHDDYNMNKYFGIELGQKNNNHTPPRPPRATMISSPCFARSAKNFPPLFLFTTVPALSQDIGFEYLDHIKEYLRNVKCAQTDIDTSTY